MRLQMACVASRSRPAWAQLRSAIARMARSTEKRLTSLGSMSSAAGAADCAAVMAFITCERSASMDSPASMDFRASSLPPNLANWSPMASISLTRLRSAARSAAASGEVFRAGASVAMVVGSGWMAGATGAAAWRWMTGVSDRPMPTVGSAGTATMETS